MPVKNYAILSPDILKLSAKQKKPFHFKLWYGSPHFFAYILCSPA